MAETNGTKWVSIKMFGIIVTILFSLIMGAYTVAGQAFTRAGDIDSEQSSMKTDISWIKDTLIRIEDKL